MPFLFYHLTIVISFEIPFLFLLITFYSYVINLLFLNILVLYNYTIGYYSIVYYSTIGFNTLSETRNLLVLQLWVYLCPYLKIFHVYLPIFWYQILSNWCYNNVIFWFSHKLFNVQEKSTKKLCKNEKNAFSSK